MRSSQETYMDVAERCSAYEHTAQKNCFCNEAPSSPSCLNCTHFAADEHCTLDLYDSIVKNL
jgi:hypothetical protein